MRRLILLVVLALLATMIIRSLPDIRRYLAMRRM